MGAGERHRGTERSQPAARGCLEIGPGVEQQQGGAPPSSAGHGERRDALVVPGVGGGAVVEQQPHRLQLAALRQAEFGSVHAWHTHGARMWHTHGSSMPSARYVHGSVHSTCLRSVVEWRSAVGVRRADESVQGGTREQDSEQLGVARARSEVQRRAAARGVADCYIDTCHSRKRRPWHQGTRQLVWQGRRTFLDERFHTESVSKIGSDQKLLGVHAWQVILHGHHLLATTSPLVAVSKGGGVARGDIKFGKESAEHPVADTFKYNLQTSVTIYIPLPTCGERSSSIRGP